ncbi:octopamine receptor beta-3R-like [Mercenaria mercenaria]|uniref:octopamine receptor beta-3R-like n=1 Tax=Mercenaria mercenaria TaxID=6596 RepID=UPI00234ED881|nr:octopamine receptor beta-3R-like [Mercenaria mercenaria]
MANVTHNKNTSSVLLDGGQDVQLRDTYETVLAVFFLLIIMLTSILGNTAVIAVICLKRSMRKEVSNLLIINLSVTDLSNTLFVMMSGLVALISDKWIFGQRWCECVCAINYCLIIVSMLTLCCISIDRYHAVMHPLSYPLRITRQRMLLIISYTWIQGITFGIAPSIAGWVAFDYWEAICAIQWHSYRPDSTVYVVIAFLICFLIPGMVLVYCYSKILKEVKNQKAQITVNTAGNTRSIEKNKKKLSDRTKIVWSLLVVVLAYFICTTPFSVTKLIKVLANGKDPIPGPINLVSALLGYVASAINPLIYGIFRRDFRTAYKHLLYLVFLQRRFSDAQSSDFPDGSGTGTISHANNLTINHDNENNTERLEHALKELQTTSNTRKETKLSPKTVKFSTNTKLSIPETDTNLNDLNALEHSKIENRQRPVSVISCKHVMVKSVNGSIDET